MELTHVLGNTWALEGAGMMGLYVTEPGKCVLLDSGEQYEREELAATLEAAGLTPAGVLSSHVHIDHSVNNGWLRRRYGCKVAVPAGEVHLTRSAVALKSYYTIPSPGMLAQYLGEMVGPVDEPVPPEDGLFPFCGVSFRIVHTPGHSLDHISILTPDGVCYVGDAVFSGKLLHAKLPYEMWVAQAMESLSRLESLSCPACIVCHRGIHQELAPLVRATRDLLLDRAEHVAALVDRPMTLDEMWERARVSFPLRPASVEIASRLERNLQCFADYLVDTGRLELTLLDGTLRYVPCTR